MAISTIATMSTPLFMRCPLSEAGSETPGFAVFVPLLDDFPVDVLEEGRDVLRPASRAVVDHEGVLEEVEHDDRTESGRVTLLVARHPPVEEAAGGGVPVEDRPADAAHAAGLGEVLAPGAHRAPRRAQVHREVAPRGELGAGGEVAEVVLVEHHAVDLEAETTLELGPRG